MFSFKSIVLIAAAFVVGAECSGVAVPAVAAAPLVAPAHVGYAHAVPQNIPPYASQVSVVNRAIAAPFAAPYLAGPAPYAVAPGFAAPAAYTAGFAAPAAYTAGFAAPAAYTAGFAAPAAYAPAAYAPAPYAAPAAFAAPAAYASPAAYAAPYPYAAAAPIVRAPLGVAPAFVR